MNHMPIPIITKQQEIEDLREHIKKQRGQLEKAIDLTVTLSRRNSELRAAIMATISENLHLADGDKCTLKRLKDAVGYKDGEDDYE